MNRNHGSNKNEPDVAVNMKRNHGSNKNEQDVSDDEKATGDRELIPSLAPLHRE